MPLLGLGARRYGPRTSDTSAAVHQHDAPPSDLQPERISTRRWTGILTCILVASTLCVFAACGPLKLVHVLFGDTLADLDQRVADGGYEMSSRWPIMLWSAHVASFLGSTVWLTAVVAGVAWYLVRRDRHRLAVLLVAAVLGGVVINKTIKRIVDRNRPDFEDALAHAAGSSFPSGHAMNSMVVYGMLLTLGCWQWNRDLRRRLVVTGAVLVVAIAASRVALGVHYLSDVTAGLLLGLVWITSLAHLRRRVDAF